MTKEEHKKPKKSQMQTSHRKVFDVTRPGKAPASPTSRPVLSRPKPVADDQFVPSAPPVRASDPNAQHDLLNPKNKKALKPLDSAATDPTDAVASGKMSVAKDTPAASALPLTAGAPTVPGEPESPPSDKPSTVAQTSDDSAPVSPSDTLTNASTAAPAVEPATPVDAESIPPEAAVSSVVSNADEPPTAPLPGAAAAVAGVSEALPVTSSGKAPQASDTPPSATPSAAAPLHEVETVEETPAHLALEQTVSADSNVPIWEHPDTSQQVEGSKHSASTNDKKSIEDLLAETGAPNLEPEDSPGLIVAHHDAHHGGAWKFLLFFLLFLIIAAVALNLLLDAEIITGVDLPHTDWL